MSLNSFNKDRRTSLYRKKPDVKPRDEEVKFLADFLVSLAMNGKSECDFSAFNSSGLLIGRILEEVRAMLLIVPHDGVSTSDASNKIRILLSHDEIAIQIAYWVSRRALEIAMLSDHTENCFSTALNDTVFHKGRGSELKNKINSVLNSGHCSVPNDSELHFACDLDHLRF